MFKSNMSELGCKVNLDICYFFKTVSLHIKQVYFYFVLLQIKDMKHIEWDFFSDA